MTWKFDAGSTIGGIVAQLEGRPRPELAPKGPWDEPLRKRILDLDPGDIVASPASADAAAAVKSGLLLWNDSLVESHVLSQEIETQTGSYWHGIMHRREPDYANSKYWWRQVGNHPAFPQVYEAALDLLSRSASPAARALGDRMSVAGQWDPFVFVDACQAAEGDPGLAATLEEVQLREIELLLAHSYGEAAGD